MKRETSTQELKPVNHKQLAARYQVSHKTLKSWMEPFAEEVGEMRGRFFTLKQLQIIYEKLGDPANIQSTTDTN